jgi:hypothetical protein
MSEQPKRELPLDDLIAALGKPTSSVNEDAARAGLDMLGRMMDRAVDAKNRTATKSALVIPAVGTIGGLIGGRIAISRATNDACAQALLDYANTGPNAEVGSCAAPVLLAAAILAAVAAIMFSLVALYPFVYRNGPDPVAIAYHTAAPTPAYLQGLIASMTAAVVSVEDLTWRMARYWQRSLVSSGVAVSAVLALGIVGGLR